MMTVRHTHLEAMKEEVMPDGDLHLLLRFERVVPAKDCASRLGFTVAEYLAKAVCLPMCLPCNTQSNGLLAKLFMGCVM